LKRVIDALDSRFFCSHTRIFDEQISNRDFVLKLVEKSSKNSVVSRVIHFGAVMQQIMKSTKMVTSVHSPPSSNFGHDN
ncbi:hypothetical protein K0M31_001325, partial [Melipona bicolor]